MRGGNPYACLALCWIPPECHGPMSMGGTGQHQSGKEVSGIQRVCGSIGTGGQQPLSSCSEDPSFGDGSTTAHQL